MRTPLWLLAGVAVLAGIYGRFKGIGTWPLGVDEFYISRSIDNVLNSGLPRFACGGYYNRGVLYQYAVAGIRLLGVGPELAGRLVAAVCSMAVLPAVYLLARRVRGSEAGWLAVIILSVSIWEIEMGRFARMYAPFQAVFTWYLVFYLRYTLDRRRAALGWLAVLSVIGVLTWEGGVLLGIANLWAVMLTHEQGRLKRAHGLRLAALTGLLVLEYWFGTNDFRGASPQGSEGSPGGASGGVGRRLLRIGADAFATLWQHHAWLLYWLLLVTLVVGLALSSLRRTGCPPERRLATVALGAGLAAAAAHSFTAAAGIYVLLLLSRLIEPPRWPRPGFFLSAAAAFAVFWLAFALWTGVSDGVFLALGPLESARSVLHQLLGFPDVYEAMIRPLGRTLPLWSVALALGILCELARSLSRYREGLDPVTALMSLLVLMVLAVAATHTERVETRYTFFLYPLLVILAVSGSLALTAWILRRAPIAVGAAIPLVCFGATEDFQPVHLAHVDRAEINFRVGMSATRAAHYYPRNDVGGAADWLATHVRSSDVVIVGIPNLDPYFGRIDYFYIDGEDQRYDAYACRDGRRERWTNHPLLHSEENLMPILASGHRVLAMVYPDTERRLRAAARSHGWSVSSAWRTIYDETEVLLIEASSGHEPSGRHGA
jgi:hypothetical protein